MQVNQAVGDLDKATQQNASLVEESTAASESLKELAREMVEAVSVFRLGSRPAALATAQGPSWTAPAPAKHRPAPSRIAANAPKALAAAGAGEWKEF